MPTKPAFSKTSDAFISPTFLVLDKVADSVFFNLALFATTRSQVTTTSIPLDSVSIALAKKDALDALARFNKPCNSALAASIGLPNSSS